MFLNHPEVREDGLYSSEQRRVVVDDDDQLVGRSLLLLHGPNRRLEIVPAILGVGADDDRDVGANSGKRLRATRRIDQA